MEADNRFPTGEWNGFYLEQIQPKRGWMHLYKSFENGQIKGEGTDYVGPWVSHGSYDSETGACQWVKKYVGKHNVEYQGVCGSNGIQGRWRIGAMTGEFHIWPKSMGNLDEMYLHEDLREPSPTMELGTVPAEDFPSIA
jgi:hypothetical protein